MNIICSREADNNRYDTRSKGLLPHGNITYNNSFLYNNKQVLIFASLIIVSRVNMELTNINSTKLFYQEPYQFNPIVLMSFRESSWS